LGATLDSLLALFVGGLVLIFLIDGTARLIALFFVWNGFSGHPLERTFRRFSTLQRTLDFTKGLTLAACRVAFYPFRLFEEFLQQTIFESVGRFLTIALLVTMLSATGIAWPAAVLVAFLASWIEQLNRDLDQLRSERDQLEENVLALRANRTNADC